ncbi:toxin co-regulated pilus biosynthesis Q family protein [Serratia quinivorans]|uniref:toxin co-regulated pilus biosynthesis Q family protein n=1 Tax=Serratia quinivorans TaxID=137545 RepID=UPI0021788252|nr:toxin co-regulated pilus biosynthesis Q family protein [Serratia quinivorans]CAI1007934.1 Toxin co-regulated pilus biosynthesis protein Q [Serratia quinivorans]CAI1808386.1 Toxin co-regulated pilus biosynthesis protein Q [Serratia quinivorans]
MNNLIIMRVMLLTSISLALVAPASAAETCRQKIQRIVDTQKYQVGQVSVVEETLRSQPCSSEMAKPPGKRVGGVSSPAPVAPAPVAPALSPKVPLTPVPVVHAPSPATVIKPTQQNLVTPPASAVVKVAKSWCASKGATLRGTLQQWAQQANWQLLWKVDFDYPIVASFCVSGELAPALSDTALLYQKADKPMFFNIYPQQSLLVVNAK